ncbi:hypothetical protein QE152_g9991 [Popillia japonica]|uniref:Craniofacial development protein 2 n=1 Tax=Popillia japonica TaxID=7064 RepID=A0AAW1LT90_POPJA
MCKVELKNYSDKREILKNKKKLRRVKEGKIYINEDLTYDDRRIQKEIRKIVKQEREKGKIVKERLHKLIINNEVWYWNETEANSCYNRKQKTKPRSQKTNNRKNGRNNEDDLEANSCYNRKQKTKPRSQKTNNRKNVEYKKTREPRILTIELKYNEKNATIIGVYGPDEDEKAENKEEFWDDLTLAVEESKGDIYLLGDFNARVGKKDVTTI